MTCALTSFVVALGAMPTPDPLGFPVPPWLIRSLAYLTLTLHLTAVHFTVGSMILYLWTRFRRKGEYQEAGRFLGAGLPLGVSYVITLGIPPLLFVQVLYGQMFYTSSVVIGAYWIQVIPALILAYACVYYHKLCRDRHPRMQTPAVLLSLVLLLYIGFIYVNNFTLAMSPQKWLSMYDGSPAGGALTHGEPTVHPRMLLFLAGAFGVAGLALLWRGCYLSRWGQDREGRLSRSLGFGALVMSPILWIAAGVGVYAARPEEIGTLLSAGWTTKGLLAVGAVGAGVAVICGYLAKSRGAPPYALLSSLGIVVVTACMVVIRDVVRIRELMPHWESGSVPVNAQWGMLAMFLGTLAVGAVVLIVLTVKVVPGLAASARSECAAGAGSAQ
jgi:hypothetical protein